MPDDPVARWTTPLLDTPPGRALLAVWEFIRFDLPDAIIRHLRP